MPSDHQTVDIDRLREVLGQPALLRLVGRLRDRLARTPALDRPLRLASPVEAERQAVARMLGQPRGRGASLTISLVALDALLRNSKIAPGGLVSALEALGGPLIDPQDEALRQTRVWADVLGPTRDWIGEQNASERGAALARWLDELEAEGLLKRLAGDPAHASDLLANTRAVLAMLPAVGWTLPELAARAVGDAHGLDGGRPLATLVQRAIARLAGLETVAELDAAARRHLWQHVGISVDALGASVLVYGLRSAGDGLVDRTLALHAAAGEPLRLTEHLLLHHPPRFTVAATGALAYVCENPAIVAAANRELSAAAPEGPPRPLICTEGQPSTAVRLLLDALRAAGIAIVAHADFDSSGLQIVSLLAERHGARPWRFDAASYLEALGQAKEIGLTALPTRGDATPSALECSSQLGAAMQRAGIVVHEEILIERLLDDLADSHAGEKTARDDRLAPRIERLGRRCPRAAWLAVHRPEEASAADPAVAQMFASRAHDVESRWRAVAGQDGADRSVLTRVRAAIEADHEDETDALASRWLDAHAAGNPLRAARLVTLGPACPLAIEPTERAGFRVVELTAAVRQRISAVAAARDTLATLVGRAEPPAQPIGPWCKHRARQDACPFVDHCFSNDDVPTPSVLDLPRAGRRAWALYRAGTRRLEDLREPQIAEQSPLQQRVIRAARIGGLVVEREALRAQIAAWRHPWMFLDFETTSPPFSDLPGLPPFAHLPFAAAVCGEAPGDTIASFVSDAPDPRAALAAWLVERFTAGAFFDDEGCLLTYDAPFVTARLNDLAGACPRDATPLRALAARLVDVRVAVEASVCHPSFGGRYDLKTVTRALLADGQDEREPPIADGRAAQAAYEARRASDTEAGRARLDAMLDAYVRNDVARLRELARWLATRAGVA